MIGSYISTSTCLYTRGIVVLDWISQSMWLDYMNTISDWNFQYGGPSSNDGGSLGYLRGGWGRSRRSCSTAWFSLTGRTCSINPQFLEVEREGKKAIMLIPAGFWPPCWGKVSWSYGWSLPRRHRASLPAAMRQLKVNSFLAELGSNISVPCNRCGSPPCYVMLQFEYVFFVDVSELYWVKALDEENCVYDNSCVVED